ncbi:hypothetical protein MGYG_07031 [Nannizzia gypsea CBS 118893]|uniref:Methyltransferase n=1 Tax=Arthroderma gypseum (strain ATCC MYA-4604 / CBS 118893) TaxID=535722 RepID=E4V1W1_ARTGP|nr:hypothetical protein MGYG_07031 [Nannizzia gypsea CBS 118893]EFR04026.1 hypothetical protein MGYG_07031 [Nannizzia gypsea CBS 118893]
MPSASDVDAVNATLRFIEDEPKWRHEKPYLILSHGLDSECPQTNVNFVERTRVIKDLRTTDPDKVLGPDLFHLVNHESRHLNSVQQEDNNNTYVHETVELLERLYQADCVVAYDVRFRRSHESVEKLEAYSPGTFREPDLPSYRAHVDVSRDCGPRRVRRYLSEKEAHTYLDGGINWRVRIVNVWRPLCPRVEDTPLAFCAPGTVSTNDLVAVDRPSERFDGEMYLLKDQPDHQWYYLSHQSPKEVFVFVSWDSDAADGTISGLPHSAFDLPKHDSSSVPRESVEVRTVVIQRKNQD